MRKVCCSVDFVSGLQCPPQLYRIVYLLGINVKNVFDRWCTKMFIRVECEVGLDWTLQFCGQIEMIEHTSPLFLRRFLFLNRCMYTELYTFRTWIDKVVEIDG